MMLKPLNVLLISLFLSLNIATFKAMELKNLEIQAVDPSYVVAIYQGELKDYSKSLRLFNCNPTVTIYTKPEWCKLYTNKSLEMPENKTILAFYLHKNGRVDLEQKASAFNDCRRTKTYVQIIRIIICFYKL
jgi:hypothetical protein